MIDLKKNTRLSEWGNLNHQKLIDSRELNRLMVEAFKKKVTNARDDLEMRHFENITNLEVVKKRTIMTKCHLNGEDFRCIGLMTVCVHEITNEIFAIIATLWERHFFFASPEEHDLAATLMVECFNKSGREANRINLILEFLELEELQVTHPRPLKLFRFLPLLPAP